jgi:hypothetical protein
MASDAVQVTQHEHEKISRASASHIRCKVIFASSLGVTHE